MNSGSVSVSNAEATSTAEASNTTVASGTAGDTSAPAASTSQQEEPDTRPANQSSTPPQNA